MSQTVQIALITFLSGIVGSIAGVMSTLIATKRSSEVEIQKTVIDRYFSARLEAYINVNRCYEIFNPFDRSTHKPLASAIYAGAVVSSNDTKEALYNFLAEINSYADNPSKCKKVGYSIEYENSFYEARDIALAFMQRDLSHFEVPRITNNK